MPAEFATESVALTNRRRRFRIASAIAATGLLILAITAILWNRKPATYNPAQVKVTADSSAAELLVHEKNNTGQPRFLLLSDGSKVTLYAHSELKYAISEKNRLRSFDLNGRAEFTVAKDSARPFIVVSGDIFTTALGTKFLVDHSPNSNSILVELYEGKVMVKSLDASQKKMNNDVFLKPGQRLLYNASTAGAHISLISTKKPEQPLPQEEPAGLDEPILSGDDKGSWYMFNNQSLPQVFVQLQDMYNTKISFSEQKLKDYYFIGKFDKNDSLDQILNQIGLINDLIIEKKNGGYNIYPKPKK